MTVSAGRLPEHAKWPDEGCPGIEGCDVTLGGDGSRKCPWPLCKAEHWEKYRAIQIASRDKWMVQLRESGLLVEQVAEIMGVSKRTVHRVLKDERDRQGTI